LLYGAHDIAGWATGRVPRPLPERSDLNAVGGRDVVCVGFNDWDNEVWTNQHHLMSRLANSGSRVLFIESLGLRQPSLGSGRDLRRIVRRLRRGLSRPRASEGVTVLSPLVLPWHSDPFVRRINARLLRIRVEMVVDRLAFQRPVLWGYVPQAELLVDTLDPALVIYHCVDDIASQAGIDALSFRASEERFARRADLVIASAPMLAERMRRFSQKVLLAPNVADTASFSGALDPGPVDEALAALSEPRIVFVGAVAAKKLDFDLLLGIARARPSWSLALIGPIGLGDPETDVSELAREPNIYVLGPREHRDLPAALRAAAIGLIPYRRSPLTESIFPMKVYEYLSAGLPVVASGLPSLEGIADVALVDGADAAVQAIERALAEDTLDRRRARSAAVHGHSWETRLDEIRAALR
jgi:glycosyltransferase involved in cell wall biosynthesis